MSKYHDAIRNRGDPILKQACAAVLPNDDLIWMDKLDRVCRKCHEAVGLAAPQIGVAKQGIFLLVKDAKGTIRGERLYNPEVFHESVEREVQEEGCMSYPGVRKNIARPKWVDIRYQKHPRLAPVVEKIHGYRARVALHEIDHLNGICKVGDLSYEDDGWMARVGEAAGADGIVRKPNIRMTAALVASVAMLGLSR